MLSHKIVLTLSAKRGFLLPLLLWDYLCTFNEGNSANNRM
jgi:hypothetical protein